jgi:integrase
MPTKTPKLEKTRTPGIYKRGGSYVVTFRNPEGRPCKRFAPSYNAAKALKDALRTDVARGEFQGRSQITFADYAREWVETYPGRTSKGIREETRSDYAKRLEQDAIPLLGKRRLSEIDAADLDKLATRVRSGPLCRDCSGRGFVPAGGLCHRCNGAGRLVKPGAISADTVRLALAPVKALLATAHQRRDLRFNPAAGYRTRHEVQAVDVAFDQQADEVKALSEDELVAFLAAVRCPACRRKPTPDCRQCSYFRSFFEFLAQTGLRIGEAIELRWNDIDLGKRTVKVQRRFYRGRTAPPKSKYGRRTVKLAPAMAQLLWLRHATTKPDAEELVWTAEKGGRIEQSNLMRRVLKPAALSVGIEWDVGFHAFRHTCATMLFRQGWNAVQVQRWLGHHKPSFTLDVYVHLLEEDMPDPSFLDEVGNTWAPRGPENDREALSDTESQKVLLSSENLAEARTVSASAAAS